MATQNVSRLFSVTLLSLVFTLFLASLLSLLFCPSSKVEESFQLQAVHDLFYHGLTPALSRLWSDSGSETTTLPYDHLQYPGVVPRSFTGPLVLSTLCHVTRWLVLGCTLGKVDLARDIFANTIQFLSRFFLLTLNAHAWYRMAGAVDRKVSSSSLYHDSRASATFLLMVSACQFHVPFYMSRMLPNTFATLLTLHAFADWIDGRSVHRAAAILVFTMTVIRCDIMLLLACCGVSWLLCRQLSVVQAIRIGVISFVGSLVLTVPLDSLLWQKVVWPEGQVLYYNTVLGKSSDWGVSPWYWYWTSAVPRALLFSVVFLPLSLVKISITATNSMTVRLDTLWLPFLLPAFGFITLYSCLGHKELRFLFPVLPLLNLGIAVGCSRFADFGYDVYNSKKNDDLNDKRFKQRHAVWQIVGRLVYLVLFGSLLLSAAASMVFVAVSTRNYPGGEALRELVTIVRNSTQLPDHVTVYIDVAAAMTGISLFGQRAAQGSTPGTTWTFVKSGYEETNQMRDGYDKFTHILSENPSIAGTQFSVVGVVPGHPRLNIRKASITTQDAIYILQHKQTVS